MPEINLTFEPLDIDSNLDDYDSLSKTCFDDVDRTTADELHHGIANGRLKSWRVLNRDTTIGFTSVVQPSPHLPWKSTHLLETMIYPALRGRGFGSAIFAWRIEQFGHQSLTTSIRPSNTVAARLATRNGFRPGLPQPPWITWHRLPSVVLCDSPTRRRLLILDQPCQHSIDATTNDILIEQLLRQASDVGFECTFTTEPPTENYLTYHQASGLGNPRILRGLWPDPAAFDLVMEISHRHRLLLTEHVPVADLPSTPCELSA